MKKDVFMGYLTSMSAFKNMLSVLLAALNLCMDLSGAV